MCIYMMWEIKKEEANMPPLYFTILSLSISAKP